MAFDLAEHPEEVQEQIDSLPDEARSDFDAAVAFIRLAPWDSPLYRQTAPEGLRRRSFGVGFGLILYQVRYDDRIQLELVQWLG